MNLEPVAPLLVGWMVLDQQLRWFEMLGAGIVLTGIVLLAHHKGC
jgi:EamA-like transporter family.